MAKEPKIIKQEYVETPQEVLPIDVNNYQDEFLYGKSVEKLDQKQVRGSSGGQYFMETTTFPSATTQTISGVGFMPKMVKISARLNGTNKGFSDGTYSDGNYYCRYVYANGGNLIIGGIGYSSYCYDSASGNATYSTIITPTADGFTVVVDSVDAGTAEVIYECYG